jgi:hypothetical protein
MPASSSVGGDSETGVAVTPVFGRPPGLSPTTSRCNAIISPSRALDQHADFERVTVVATLHRFTSMQSQRFSGRLRALR